MFKGPVRSGFLPNWDEPEPKPVAPYGMTLENWTEPQKTGPKRFKLVRTDLQAVFRY